MIKQIKKGACVSFETDAGIARGVVLSHNTELDIAVVADEEGVSQEVFGRFLTIEVEDGASCCRELSWEDYCALTTGGMEDTATVGRLYEKLTGEKPAAAGAAKVFKTVLAVVRGVTKEISKAITEE